MADCTTLTAIWVTCDSVHDYTTTRHRFDEQVPLLDNRAACLHAPFPLAIYTDSAGTHIAYTRPSGLFGPLRSQAIDEIAAGLDVRISRTVEGACSLP